MVRVKQRTRKPYIGGRKKKSKIHVRKPVSSEGTSIFAETSSPATNPNEGESEQPKLSATSLKFNVFGLNFNLDHQRSEGVKDDHLVLFQMQDCS